VAPRRRLDDLHLGDRRLAEPLDLGEARTRRRDRLRERAEAGDQLLGERLDVAARQRPEQHQFHELVIGDGVAAGVVEPRPQPLAMAVIVRRRVLEAGPVDFWRRLVGHGSSWRG
jgi:hypothetical protein